MHVSVSPQFLKTEQSKSYELKGSPSYLASDCLFIKQGAIYHKVRVDDITFLESDNVYIHVNTMDKKFLVRNTIEQYLEILNLKQFVRIHRSYAVNINHVQLIDTHHVTINNNPIPMGKTYRQELLSSLRLG
jgi:two-component system, LytTR family, response regulator LytT